MAMLQSQTAVLERNTTFGSDFETEPYEVAWSREARWFVTVLEHQGAPVTFTTQVSPDGLHWLDLPDDGHSADAAGMISWAVREYGHWLRLRANFAEGGGQIKVRLYLALKS